MSQKLGKAKRKQLDRATKCGQTFTVHDQNGQAEMTPKERAEYEREMAEKWPAP